MSYDAVDSVIDAWVPKHRFTLFSKFGGRPAKLIYFSQGSECCQIWIEPPLLGEIVIHACDVETLDNEEVKMDWTVFTPELEATLENAVSVVRQWFER